MLAFDGTKTCRRYSGMRIKARLRLYGLEVTPQNPVVTWGAPSPLTEAKAAWKYPNQRAQHAARFRQVVYATSGERAENEAAGLDNRYGSC
jgi:hypothetical protein